MKRLTLAALAVLALLPGVAMAQIAFEQIPSRGSVPYVQLPTGTFQPAPADASGRQYVNATPDGVADGAVKTASVTSATTIVTFSADELKGMNFIAFGFTAVGTTNTVGVDTAADGTNFNAAAAFWRSSTTGATHASSITPVTTEQYIVPVNGQAMRIRVVTYTSGTVTVYAVAKRGMFPIPTALTVTGTVTTTTGGNVGSAATDSGNPVKIGCKYNSTVPTVTDGQRVDVQCDPNGGVRSVVVGNRIVGADGTSNSNLITFVDRTATTSGSGLVSMPYNFNGTNWDRQFTCSSSAAVSVTAGNTTEIVGLTASQVVRVCGFSVSMSAAGTAKWVYGTGTNCGTGTTDLTGAMTLAQGAPWTYGGGATGSVMRGATANAVCLQAVTGNVTGILTYSKY